MDDINIPVFAQAKLEYTKQLVDVLYMNMYDGIRSIYDDSKRLYATRTGTPIILLFRTLLEKVPRWNSEIIEAETQRISQVSKCDWLDDLLTAVFISHTRILMSIGPNQNYNKINVTIPKTTTFIHKTYINVSREIWKNPYLFNENVLGHEYQRNMKQVEDIIKLTIEDTIRRQLPIKEILREHLESQEESKSVSQNIDLKMIMKELQKTNRDNKEEEEEEEEKVDDSTNEDVQGDVALVEENVEDTDEKVTILPSFITKEEDTTDELSKTEGLVKVGEPVKESEPVKDSEPPKVDEPKVDELPKGVFEDPYKDPDDPSQADIEKACVAIVINDITEPVVEPTYDNTDIVTKNDTEEDKSKKLEGMLSDLTKSETKTETKDGIDTKPVIKIDDSSKGPSISIPQPKKETSVIKLDDSTPKPPKEPFSFSNPYSSITGQGKVETITEGAKVGEPKVGEPKAGEQPNTSELSKSPELSSGPDKKDNAQVMKEVIKIDKKEEAIDETETLDNFYNDLHTLSKTKDKKEHQVCYTLFEDANESEQ